MQLSMFQARAETRPRHGESPALYEAVRQLRSAGYQVYRHGLHQHRVTRVRPRRSRSALLDTRQLFYLADQVGKQAP